MKNILITGGAGFIGSNLALKLVAGGYNVTVLDNLSPQIHGKNPEIDSTLYNSIKGKVNFIHGSVCDVDLFRANIIGQDVIYHLAAETGTGQSMYEISRYFEVNVQGTANLLNLLGNARHSVKKILVSSSRSVYGEGKYLDKFGQVIYPKARADYHMSNAKFNPIDEFTNEELAVVATDELSRIHPISVYGITKQFQEEMVMRIAPTIGISPVALRYQNVYGPGQSLSNPYTGILAVFSTRILNGNSIEIFEDGLESRDFVYIDDVVEATIMAMNSLKSCEQVFNVGTGVAIPVMYIAQKLTELYARQVEIKVTGKYRVGDIRHNYADMSKIRDMLGFKSKVNFDTGLAEFANWVKTQRVQEDNFDKSMAELKAKGLFK